MSVLSVKEFGTPEISLTDFYIGVDQRAYELADNLVVDEYSKLISYWGRELDFTTSLVRAQVPVSVSTRRIGLLMPQKTGANGDFTILKQVGATLQYDNGTTMTELVGPASASAFTLTSPVSDETAFSYADWNNHTIITHESPYQKPVKCYRESGGTLTMITAGLPRPASGFTATGGAGATYVYALVHKFTYNVGSTQFIDRSSPYLSTFTNIGTATASSSPGVTVGSIPVLSNTAGAGEHYATTTIKIEVYRTTNNGSVLYYVGEVTNGTTTYSDTTSDNTLTAAGVTIYTTGGVVNNDRPPKTKFVHGTTDFVYYANGYEVGVDSADLQPIPQRLWQSKRGDPDSVPASFFADMEEPITGISSVRSIPVVFCQNSIYRIDGSFDDLGRGGMTPKKISDKIGGVGHLSIVQTIEGLFFAGNDGFYFTDGYQVTPLSERFQITYSNLVSTDLKKKRIYGAFDSDKTRVIWATSSKYETTGDNAKFYILDLKRRSFTTASSGFSNQTGPTIARSGASISGTAVTLSDSTGINKGDRAILTKADSTISLKAYVVSVDSTTQVTISESSGAMSGLTAEFIVNTNKQAYFYRNFEPTALLFYNGYLYSGDRKGFTMKYSRPVVHCPFLDTVGDPSTFSLMSLNYLYKSTAMDFGTTEYRKWCNKVLVKARPPRDLTSKMSMLIESENDDDNHPDELQVINFDSNRLWGSLTYGDPLLYQTLRTLIDVWRRFPANRLRCEYKQLHMSTGFVVVDQSGTSSSVAVTAGANAVAKTITLSDNTWEDDVFDYWISLETDGYVTNYRIINRVSDTVLTVLDPANNLSTSLTGQKWVLRGYPKTSLLNLIEYSVYFETLGDSQQQYNNENTVSQ